MTSLKIDEATARKVYPSAIPEFKAILEKSFPTGFFSQKITDRIQGWDDILSITGADSDDYKLRPGETDDELANRQSKLISLAYNEGRVLDAGNSSQNKYYPWFIVVKDESKPSGFGLSFFGYDCWNSSSYVGFRHCFDKAENAIDAGKKFISIYERQKIR
jgi:hypothetical protein